MDHVDYVDSTSATYGVIVLVVSSYRNSLVVRSIINGSVLDVDVTSVDVKSLDNNVVVLNVNCIERATVMVDSNVVNYDLNVMRNEHYYFDLLLRLD